MAENIVKYSKTIFDVESGLQLRFLSPGGLFGASNLHWRMGGRSSTTIFGHQGRGEGGGGAD